MNETKIILEHDKLIEFSKQVMETIKGQEFRFADVNRSSLKDKFKLNIFPDLVSNDENIAVECGDLNINSSKIKSKDARIERLLEIFKEVWWFPFPTLNNNGLPIIFAVKFSTNRMDSITIIREKITQAEIIIKELKDLREKLKQIIKFNDNNKFSQIMKTAEEKIKNLDIQSWNNEMEQTTQSTTNAGERECLK